MFQRIQSRCSHQVPLVQSPYLARRRSLAQYQFHDFNAVALCATDDVLYRKCAVPKRSARVEIDPPMPFLILAA